MITINSNAASIASNVSNINKQLAFGISKGINKLAEHIRDSELQAAKNTFSLRGSWYQPRSKFGFNVKPSTKNNLTAEIYTKADWLERHAVGGIKTAKGMIAIPTQFVRRNKKDVINKANRPMGIKGAVKVTFKTGQQAIVKAYKADGKKLVVLYWLEKQAKIKKVYDFNDIGRKVFDRNASKYVSDGIAEAIRTAR